jgi:ribosomal protein S25
MMKEIPVEVIYHSRLTPMEKLVFLALADSVWDRRIGENVTCWSRIRDNELADKFGIGERTARNYLNGLEEKGYIKRITEYGAGRRIKILYKADNGSN